MLKPSCETCTNSYQTPDLSIRCAVFGCVCSEKTSNNCADYVREVGSDDDADINVITNVELGTNLQRIGET